MQSIILSSQPLQVNSLHQALKRLNIESICARIRALSEWRPDTDAVIFTENTPPIFFDLLERFIDELPSKTPLFFLLPQTKEFRFYFRSILDRCIFIGNSVHVDEAANIICEIMIESYDTCSEELICGPIVMNRQFRYFAIAGHSIPLTRKEYCLMELLTRNYGKIITRERIKDYVWDHRRFVSQNTIDVYISRLRKKLPNMENGPIIKTVPCMGYSLHLH